MKKSMRVCATLVLGVGVFAKPLVAGALDAGNSILAFEKLSALAGRWEATSPMGKVTTSYKVVSGGSVVLERMEVSGKDPMVTTYHLDGGHLLLEHYCHAGNRPHMQARAFHPESSEIDFDFVSATNLASPGAGHMHRLALRFSSADEFTADWTWAENGKTGGHNVSLVYHRVK
jgi:hypothetical protein